MTDKSAVIIGAGLTGLTTAFYLKKAGWKVTILERSKRAGGSIQTHRENGFIFESGPNTGIVSHPEVADLFAHLGRPITSRARQRRSQTTPYMERMPLACLAFRTQSRGQDPAFCLERQTKNSA
jgi:phytoene dehydrogenase-like protein